MLQGTVGYINRNIQRTVKPQGDPRFMRTFQITAPIASHYRVGTCEESGCLAHHNGWKSLIDESSSLGQQQANYIRKHARRKYTEQKDPNGKTEFVFEAGQTCFAQHKVPLERPALYIVKDGDFRGNPTGFSRRHTKPEHWVEDFSEHQDRVARDRS